MSTTKTTPFERVLTVRNQAQAAYDKGHEFHSLACQALARADEATDPAEREWAMIERQSYGEASDAQFAVASRLTALADRLDSLAADMEAEQAHQAALSDLGSPDQAYIDYVSDQALENGTEADFGGDSFGSEFE